MKRSVISFMESGDGAVAVRVSEPAFGGDPKTFGVMDVNALEAQIRDFETNQLDQAGISQLGQALFAELEKSAGVAQELAGTRAGGASVCLELSAGCEDVPWEVLFDQHLPEFLALRNDVPLARLPQDAGPPPSVPPHTIGDPIEMVAVLSVLPFDPYAEFESIRRAVENSGASVNLTVLLGHRQARDQIEALDLPWVTVDTVGATGMDLVQNIRKRRPQILHFSCHGADGAVLEVATTSDWRRHNSDGSTQSSIRVDHSVLDFGDPADWPWLITLNACEGAAVPANGFGGAPLARRLVENGAAAVVGMRERVPNQEAEIFAEALYYGVLNGLHRGWQQSQTSQKTIVVDWGRFLAGARNQLKLRATSSALAARVWTLPVLYVRQKPFMLRAASSGLSTPRRVSLEKQLFRLSALLDDSLADPQVRAEINTILQELWHQ